MALAFGCQTLLTHCCYVGAIASVKQGQRVTSIVGRKIMPTFFVTQTAPTHVCTVFKEANTNLKDGSLNVLHQILLF